MRKINYRKSIIQILIVSISLLIISGSFLVPFSKTSEGLDDNNGNLHEKENLISSPSDMIELDPFIIDDSGGGDYNWTEASNEEWCQGSGTAENPYIISGITIDGSGNSDCIQIKNSDVYFEIELSLFQNSDYNGILLQNVNNGVISNCNISNSKNGINIYSANEILIRDNYILSCRKGINLGYSDYNEIFNNSLSTSEMAIYIEMSDYNQLKNNTITCNKYGIFLDKSQYTILKHNKMYKSGLFLEGSNEMHYSSHYIDNTTTVNEKEIYFYINEKELNSDNFTDPGQIFLIKCDMSTITNLSFSEVCVGITLVYCEKNNVSFNHFEECSYGIQLFKGEKNFINQNNFEALDLEASYTGISISSSDSNFIYKNIIWSSSEGIELIYSYENYIISNRILNYDTIPIFSFYSQNFIEDNFIDKEPDGMDDNWEILYGLDPNDFNDGELDMDKDNLSNYIEYCLGTKPNEIDSDSDGMPDGWELFNKLNPLKDDSYKDLDGDTLSNGDEYEYQTDPNLSDTDGDGLNDGEEVHKYGTDPLKKDTDGDGFSDYNEVEKNSDPLDRNDTPASKSLGMLGFFTLVGLIIAVSLALPILYFNRK